MAITALPTLYRAWQVARDDAAGLALPSGHRPLLPVKAAPDVLYDRANYLRTLGTAAAEIGRELPDAPPELNRVVVDRLPSSRRWA